MSETIESIVERNKFARSTYIKQILNKQYQADCVRAVLRPSKVSMMELLAKTVYRFWVFTIFAKGYRGYYHSTSTPLLSHYQLH